MNIYNTEQTTVQKCGTNSSDDWKGHTEHDFIEFLLWNVIQQAIQLWSALFF